MRFGLLILDEWWFTLTHPEQLFWGVALVASLLFLIQFVMNLISGDLDADTDLDTSEIGFNLDLSLLSLRSILAFFAFLGWGGALMLQAGLPVWLSSVIGFATGLFAFLITGYLMTWFTKMTQIGNVELENVLFKTGEVYLTIPAYSKGIGKIHVHLGGSLREMDAVTEGVAIENGVHVRVLRILENQVLLVEAVHT